MALCGASRLLPTAVFVLVLSFINLNLCLAEYDESYLGYELDTSEVPQGFVDFRPSKVVKRSLLTPIIQPEPGGAGDTSSNKSPDTTNKPDRGVLKDAVLLSNNSSSKTGGNYQTESSAAPTSKDPLSPVIANSTAPKVIVTKWVDVAKSGKTLNTTDANTEKDSAAPVDATTTTSSDSQNVVTTPKTKSDGKSAKKVELETKPPKPEPTKPSFDDKASKKTVAPDTKGATTESVLSSSTTVVNVLIPSFPEDDLSNKTLQLHNINQTDEDHHQYYNSSFFVNNPTIGLSYWINMTDRQDVQVNELLSQSHRRAATVKLSFDFPFYGHMVRNVTIATGGFLYTGDYVHSWLAATQYIAPLMANFDTSISNASFVKYVDNGTAFTVQWEKVVLQDRPTSGDFTFQATLHSNGDIVFVYQKVPVVIENIQDDLHPVKVGLSDAYIIDRTIFFVRRKTIYEYHRVNFDRQDIKNWTVIYLNALPTCLDAKDCNDCLSRSTNFACNWCPSSNRCSNGMDRYRQEWLLRGCDRTSITNTSQCAVAGQTSISPAPDAADPSQAYSDKHSLSEHDTNSSMGALGIFGILFTVVFVLFTAWFLLYSYRNPLSASGQFLIRHRPSTWSWRRGEARYTAATIHM